MFTFCWENKFLIGQSTKNFSVKTGFKELKKRKQNLVEKIFGDPLNFGGLDSTNELWIEEHPRNLGVQKRGQKKDRQSTSTPAQGFKSYLQLWMNEIIFNW